MKSADFKKAKIAIEFRIIATTIVVVVKSWFNEIIVDRVPGPAIIGNAIGKIEGGIGSLEPYDSIPKTIRTPKYNNSIAPANAK